MLFAYCVPVRAIDDNALQRIYRAVVIAKLTYASSAWWALAMFDLWGHLKETGNEN